jgi:hypothetical protein
VYRVLVLAVMHVPAVVPAVPAMMPGARRMAPPMQRRRGVPRMGRRGRRVRAGAGDDGKDTRNDKTNGNH